jgi:hypothetical protein
MEVSLKQEEAVMSNNKPLEQEEAITCKKVFLEQEKLLGMEASLEQE